MPLFELLIVGKQSKIVFQQTTALATTMQYSGRFKGRYTLFLVNQIHYNWCQVCKEVDCNAC